MITAYIAIATNSSYPNLTNKCKLLFRTPLNQQARYDTNIIYSCCITMPVLTAVLSRSLITLVVMYCKALLMIALNGHHVRLCFPVVIDGHTDVSL